MNGKEWHKNDTSYYAVYYTYSNGVKSLDVVTNNFGKWLKRENKSRVNEGQVTYDADDFWLEDVKVFIDSKITIIAETIGKGEIK